jgi:hypothetical protein
MYNKSDHKNNIEDDDPGTIAESEEVHFSDIRMIAFGSSRGDELLFAR